MFTYLMDHKFQKINYKKSFFQQFLFKKKKKKNINK